MARKDKKLRVRKHAVVLNRSAGGDAGIFFFLAIMGIFMFLPMYYTIVQNYTKKILMTQTTIMV